MVNQQNLIDHTKKSVDRKFSGTVNKQYPLPEVFVEWHFDHFTVIYFFNQKVFKILVLRDIGGRNIDEFVRHAMPFMMTNNLAMQYNMTGRKGKRSFSDTIFWNINYGKHDK